VILTLVLEPAIGFADRSRRESAFVKSEIELGGKVIRERGAKVD
jgi:hypothetical protein